LYWGEKGAPEIALSFVGEFVRRLFSSVIGVARKHVQETENQFRTLAESIPHLVWMADETGRIFWYNRRWYDYTGTTFEQMAGWGWKTVHDPQVLPQVMERWQSAIASGVSFEMVVPLRGADGEFRPFLTRIEPIIEPIKDESGRIVRWFGTSTDINDQEKLRHEVESSDDKLRSFIEAASQGILGISANGRIALVNHRTEEMFGYAREELLGQSLEMLLPERFRAGHAAHRDGYFTAAGMELAGRRKDGTEFPIEIGLGHAKTPEGHLAFGMVSDISERRKAADDLKRVNEELRQSYIEIEQFAHVASHDLQEPLRMVTSYLQLIERRYNDRLDEDGREFIHFAVDGARRMKALIKDLLDFSRTGTDATNRQAVDTRVLLDNALSNLKTAIDESSAQITSDPLPVVAVDPVLFTQVFQNLIANAIKFQKDTAPRIHVSVERRPREWVFSVKDNGIGIEPHHRDRIFLIFERLHTTEQYSGSGIGLAITRKIVERHGGRIWVESQPGGGSTFHFSISAEMEFANAASNG
jgi:PAS domain S-box-containing protein